MAFCGNCGMKVTDGTKFCPGCGTKLPEVQAAASVQEVAPAVASAQAVSPTPEVNPAPAAVALAQTEAPAVAAPAPAAAQSQPAQQTDFMSKIQSLNNTADTTADYTAEDIEQNKVMALLAYLGLLFLVPLFAAPNSKYARYHTNQGLVLCLAAVAFGIVHVILTFLLLMISWRLSFLSTIIGLLWIAFPVWCVIGIINALNGKAKELPIIGKIKILK